MNNFQASKKGGDWKWKWKGNLVQQTHIFLAMWVCKRKKLHGCKLCYVFNEFCVVWKAFVCCRWLILLTFLWKQTESFVDQLIGTALIWKISFYAEIVECYWFRDSTVFSFLVMMKFLLKREKNIFYWRKKILSLQILSKKRGKFLITQKYFPFI